MLFEKQIENSKRSKSEYAFILLVGLVLLVNALFLVFITLLSVYEDFDALLRTFWKTFFVGEVTSSMYEKGNGSGSEKEHHPHFLRETMILSGFYTFQIFINYFTIIYVQACSVTIFDLLGHPKSNGYFEVPLWKIVRNTVLVGFFLSAIDYTMYIAKGYITFP